MKITLEQAQEIRQRVAAGENQRTLAAEYGVSHQCISQVVRFDSHIPSGMDVVQAVVPSSDLALLQYVATRVKVPVSSVVSRALALALADVKDQPLEAVVARLTVAS